MTRILPAKEILDIKSAALARIQRADALVYFGAKRVQLFDMGKQLAADLLLIGVRQARELRNGLFERVDHVSNLAHFNSSGFRIWGKKRRKQGPVALQVRS